MAAKITNDGYGKMTHWARRGIMCSTRYIPDAGYFWQWANATDWNGPFATRQKAVEAEAQGLRGKPWKNFAGYDGPGAQSSRG